MIREWIAERDTRIFGFKITPTTEAEILAAVELAVTENEQLVIASMNLHGLYVACVDDEFRSLHDLPQSLVHTDGSAPVYLAKMRGLDVTFAHRTGVHDWLPPLANLAGKNGWRIYCLGSDEAINDRAVHRLQTLAATSEPIVGGRNGFFDQRTGSAENEEVLAEIDAFDPEIVVVGMGMGRQEKWILDNLDQLGDRTIITCGACLEYMAGAMKLPPKWFGPTGLFMVWRVLSRPRRYGFRYLVEPWLLAWQLLGRRKD